MFEILDWWYWIILFLQIACQAGLFTFYFKSRHRLRNFCIYFALYLFVLWPIMRAPALYNLTLLKNVLNMTLQFLTCWMLNRQQKLSSIVQLVLANEVCQVVSELMSVLLVFLVTGRPPAAAAFLSDQLFIYIFATIMMFFTTLIVLRHLSRSFPASLTMHTYLFSLLLTIILTSFCTVMAIVPDYHLPFTADYLFLVLTLSAINAVTLVSLLRNMKKDAQKQALEQIQQTYQKQVEVYLQSEAEEEKLRRLRHDLKNFVQAQQSSHE